MIRADLLAKQAQQNIVMMWLQHREMCVWCLAFACLVCGLCPWDDAEIAVVAFVYNGTEGCYTFSASR
jgi:hypothetical protein